MYQQLNLEAAGAHHQMAFIQDPLILHSCGFEALDFRRTPSLQSTNITVVAAALNEHLVRAGLLWSVVQRLKSDTTTGG